MTAKGPMRALVKTQAGRGISLAEVLIPQMGPGDHLMRVEKVSVCSTDVHVHQRDP